MLESMPASLFRDWLAYDQQYPLGDLRTEVEFARLRLVIASMFAEERLSPLDFMWSFLQPDASSPAPAAPDVAEKLMAVFNAQRPSDGD